MVTVLYRKYQPNVKSKARLTALLLDLDGDKGRNQSETNDIPIFPPWTACMQMQAMSTDHGQGEIHLANVIYSSYHSYEVIFCLGSMYKTMA
jgi:hypothetical protein